MSAKNLAAWLGDHLGRAFEVTLIPEGKPFAIKVNSVATFTDGWAMIARREVSVLGVHSLTELGTRPGLAQPSSIRMLSLAEAGKIEWSWQDVIL